MSNNSTTSSSKTLGEYSSAGGDPDEKTSLWMVKYRSMSPESHQNAVEQGWRYSKSSVSTIYQSALEDFSSSIGGTGGGTTGDSSCSSLKSLDADFSSITTMDQDQDNSSSVQPAAVERQKRYAHRPKWSRRHDGVASSQSPNSSFHSIHENDTFHSVKSGSGTTGPGGGGGGDPDDTDHDIFSSPNASPHLQRKAGGKSVAFQEVMTLKDIDFVLVWDGASEAATSSQAIEKRRIFERNLEEEGLLLEREKMESSNYNFVKIHAPTECLRRYSEILKLRMPMKELRDDVVDRIFSTSPEWNESGGQGDTFPEVKQNAVFSVAAGKEKLTRVFRLDERLFPRKETKLTAVYSRDKEYLFDVDESEFFTTNVRGRVVDFILSRKRYSDDEYDDFAFGIPRLLKDGVLTAAYPLHDGDIKEPGTSRHLLYTEWAAASKCLKYQPLDQIQEYFGIKIGLYFAWLGYYTRMLIPAAVFGLICFLYGCFTLSSDTLTRDICNYQTAGQPMCPLCDKLCDYWDLKDTCSYAKVTYLFDNEATVAFAIVMSFWTAIFLEFWLRYSAEIAHRWDLTGYDVDDEHPRPEYLARLKNSKKQRINIVTKVAEPYVPFWKIKLPYAMFSVSMVLLLISLALAAVVGVILYRLAVLVALNKLNRKEIHSWSLMIVNATAAVINLVFIFFFNWLYGHLAEVLTDLEFHRTQTQFDDSITLKMYLLQFINYYSSIFYIAFFKGRFVGSPVKYTKLLGYRQEECAPGGCMTELCIQLTIIMVGKQAMNMITETTMPIIWKWWNHVRIMTGTNEEKDVIFNTRWAKDLKLLEWGPRSLFPEYLEMILQYGFVTIFVAAFPLAPVFALINNILEMRFDAKKLITYYRRPVGQRVKDIGIWYGIMDTLSKFAVISNAFIIAFTSNFIPKMVYRADNGGSLEGFLEHSLASFSTSEANFVEYSRPDNDEFDNVTVCRYQAYRGDHNLPEGLRYKRTEFYWRVWMARLAFIVVFENVVATCVILLRWLIPDEPEAIRNQIRRETYLTNEIIIKHEMLRARGVSYTRDSTGRNPRASTREMDVLHRSDSNSPRPRKRQSNGVDDNSESAEVMV